MTSSDYLAALARARRQQSATARPNAQPDDVDIDWRTAADLQPDDKPLWATLLEPLKLLNVAGGAVYSGVRSLSEAHGLIEDDGRSFLDTWGDAINEGEGFGDMFRDVGFGDEDDPGWQRFMAGAAGFGLDVALDPTTYVTFGTSALGKKALMEAAEAAGKVATREIVERAGREGADVALRRLAGRNAEFVGQLGVQSVDDVAKLSGEQIVTRLRANAPDILERAAGVEDVDEIARAVIRNAAEDHVAAAAVKAGWAGSGRMLWDDLGGTLTDALTGQVDDATAAARQVFLQFDRNLRGGMKFGVGKYAIQQDVTRGSRIPGSDVVRGAMVQQRYALRRAVSKAFGSVFKSQSELAKWKRAMFDAGGLDDLAKFADDAELHSTLLSAQRMFKAQKQQALTYRSMVDDGIERWVVNIERRAYKLGLRATAEGQDRFDELFQLADLVGVTRKELDDIKVRASVIERLGSDDLIDVVKRLSDEEAELFDDMAFFASLGEREGWHRKVFGDDFEYQQGFQNRVMTPEAREFMRAQGKSLGMTSSTKKRTAFITDTLIVGADDAEADLIAEIVSDAMTIGEANSRMRQAWGVDFDFFTTNGFEAKQVVYNDLAARRSQDEFIRSLLGDGALRRNPRVSAAEFRRQRLAAVRHVENLLLEGVLPTEPILDAVRALSLGGDLPKGLREAERTGVITTAVSERLSRAADSIERKGQSLFAARHTDTLNDIVRLLDEQTPESLDEASDLIAQVLRSERDDINFQGFDQTAAALDEALRVRSLFSILDDESEDVIAQLMSAAESSSPQSERGFISLLDDFVERGLVNRDKAVELAQQVGAANRKQNAGFALERQGMQLLDGADVPNYLREQGAASFFAGDAISDMVRRTSTLNTETGKREFLKYIDSFTTIWKAYTTVALHKGPAYHLRNKLGGMSNNFAGGVRLVDVGLGDKFASVAMKTEREIAESTARVLPSDMPKYRAEIFRKHWEASTFPGAEWNPAEQMFDTPWDAYAEFKRLSLDKTRAAEAVERKAMDDVYRQKATSAGSDKFDEIIMQRRRADALAGKPGALDELRRPITRGDRLEVQAQHGRLMDNKAVEWGSSIAEATELSLRIPAFLTGARRFGTADAGAMFVKALHFDYGDLTPFEKKVMRRVVPFWAWTRNNIPLQARLMLNRPGGFQNLIDLQENLAASLGDPGIDERLLPGWAESKLGFLVNSPLTPGGLAVVRMETPKLDLLEWIDTDGWDGPTDLPFIDITGGVNTIAGALSPAARAANNAAQLAGLPSMRFEGDYGVDPFSSYDSTAEAFSAFGKANLRSLPGIQQVFDAADLADSVTGPDLPGDRSKGLLTLGKYLGVNLSASGLSDEKLERTAERLEREDRSRVLDAYYEAAGLGDDASVSEQRAVQSYVRQLLAGQGIQYQRNTSDTDARATLRRYLGN